MKDYFVSKTYDEAYAKQLEKELSEWREWATPVALGYHLTGSISDSELRSKISYNIAKQYEENLELTLQMPTRD